MKMNSILFKLLILGLFYCPVYGQVNTESFRIDKSNTGFSIISEVEFTLMAGNTDFQYFGSNTRLNQGWTEEHNTFLIINGGFGRKEGNTFFSESLAHLRNVHALGKKLQAEEFIQYNTNKSLLLLDRFLAGGGVRYELSHSESSRALLGTALFVELENYDLAGGARHDAQTETIRFSTYFTLTLKPKEDITFLSVSYLQPDIQQLNDVRILSNNALQVKLTQSTHLNIKLDVLYDSRPADGIKKLDLLSKIGLAIAY